VLIVAEKPDAARRIALVLDENEKPSKESLGALSYYRSVRSGKNLLIVPVLGHMYTLVPREGGRQHYPVFDCAWSPKGLIGKVDERVRALIREIEHLASEAKEFINACDYDVEGSLIGYTILKFACQGKDPIAKRMKLSTLTKKEILEAFNSSMSALDFGLIEAGETRHLVDWLYGINLSRALTLAALRSWKRYATLSIGRVQGPTLGFVSDREGEILSFVPQVFWELKARISVDGQTVIAELCKGRIDTAHEAENTVQECLGHEGLVSGIDVKKYSQEPLKPFDLGTLQAEAYRIFGFSPSRSLRVAERLYLSALISYPRTSSQKIPDSVDCESILRSLAGLPSVSALAQELVLKGRYTPTQGAKEDPAHPAIYPTGDLPQSELGSDEAKLYDLVVRRFLALFGEPAFKESVKVVIQIGPHPFQLSGRRVISEGWARYYQPYFRTDEVALPSFQVGQRLRVSEILSDERFTSPPSRFNAASLLDLMEESGIGTKATRAEIIDTLYDRGYIAQSRMVATDLGLQVSRLIRMYCPVVASIDLTRQLEQEMESIEVGRERKREILAKAIAELKPALEKLKENELVIGEKLRQALRSVQVQKNRVGPCPICGKGDLVIMQSRKTGKRFVGCTDYFDGGCRASFPLPQRAFLKPLSRTCPRCQWPMILVRSSKRRPWNLCINPRCPRKKHQGDVA